MAWYDYLSTAGLGSDSTNWLQGQLTDIGLLQDPKKKFGEAQGISGQVNEANFGLPGSPEYNARLNALQQGLNQRQTPGLSADQITQGQGNYLAMLQNQAVGGGPSAANVQLQQALSRNLANQQALQASARPGNQAMAARMASQQSGALGGSLAGQGALARVQEQLGAQQQLGQALQSGQAGYLQGQGQTDQARQAALAQQLQAMQAQQSGGLAREQLRQQYFQSAMGLPSVGQQYWAGVGSLGGKMI